MKFVLLRPYKNDLSGQINEFNAVGEKGAKLDRRGRQFKRSSNLSARNQTVTVTPRSRSEIGEGFDHAPFRQSQVNSKDLLGDTALLQASRYGFASKVKWGEPKSTHRRRMNLHPLHFAAKPCTNELYELKGQVVSIQWDAGANVVARTRYKRNTLCIWPQLEEQSISFALLTM